METDSGPEREKKKTGVPPGSLVVPFRSVSSPSLSLLLLYFYRDEETFKSVPVTQRHACLRGLRSVHLCALIFPIFLSRQVPPHHHLFIFFCNSKIWKKREKVFFTESFPAFFAVNVSTNSNPSNAFRLNDFSAVIFITFVSFDSFRNYFSPQL